MKSIKFKTVLFGLLILLLFLMIQLFTGIAGGIFASIFWAIRSGGHFVYEEMLATVQPYILFISEIISIIVFGIWYYFEHVKPYYSENGESSDGVRNICTAKALSFIVCSTFSGFSFALLISHVVGALWPASQAIFDQLMSLSIGDDTIIGYLTIMFFAPVAEELAFRGVLLQKSKKVFGMTGCIILNSILFAVMHMNPLQSLYVLPIAAIYTYLAYHYRTVFTSILAHIINNSLGVLIPFALHRDLTNVETVVTLLLFSALTVFLYRYNKPKYTDDKIRCTDYLDIKTS